MTTPRNEHLPALNRTVDIEAVLVAEFDIDIGSSLTFQYPPNYTKSNNFLPPMNEKYTIKTKLDLTLCSSFAEFMLPDGAHLREEDWTIFFLRPTSNVRLFMLLAKF